MGFTQELRERHADIWERMVSHPFVIEMGDGTLGVERARRYFLQDYVFVNDLVGMASLAIAKAPDFEAASHLHAFLGNILDPQAAAENDFFLRAFDVLGATPEEYSAATANPVTQAFGDFMMRVGLEGSFEDVVAVLYVSEGIYLDWATRLLEQGKKPANPIYNEWIQLHSPAVLSDFVDWLVAYLDSCDLTARRNRIEFIFHTTLRYELMFWQAAYDGQAWLDE